MPKEKPRSPINSVLDAYISCIQAPSKYACDARGNKVARFDKNLDCDWSVTRRKVEKGRENVGKFVAGLDLGLGVTKAIAGGIEKFADEVENDLDPYCKLVSKK
jgi:hypothetical protein